jgi:hypothetical protein
MARRKRPGRAKGRRNRGYFYRKGRGWFTSSDEKLCDPEGNHLRNPEDNQAAETAYVRYIADHAANPATLNSPRDSMLVADVCQRYLDHAERENAAETYRLRADFLFDFCSGLPASFREQPGKAMAVCPR